MQRRCNDDDDRTTMTRKLEEAPLMAMAPEKAGIGLRRHFTAEGTHPYDEVEWERRDARITNYRDGSVAFEQRDVEFPRSWSQNATNIVAQKYFRGSLGSPERERSLRQVIDRVVDTITGWGAKDGYFVDVDEAEAFRAELKHLLVHQKAAFNSPVWFNIGVAGEPQQASACQPWDALVSTPDGLVPIGALVDQKAIGAKVFDVHGLTSVVAVKANGRKTVLRVHTSAGYTLDVTADHLVWADGKGFIPAGQLSNGDQVEWHATESWGDGQITREAVAEAGLAGWIQAGGFVVDVRGKGVAGGAVQVAGETEERWLREALSAALPGLRAVAQGAPAPTGSRRLRIEGTGLAAFVQRWGLNHTGPDAAVPDFLFTAPLPVAAGYLRSLFQAEGWLSSTGAIVGLAMSSERVVRGVQSLLLRFGVFSKVRRVAERRAGGSDFWVLNVSVPTDGHRFADEIGFIDPRRTADMDAALAKVRNGNSAGDGAADASARLLEVESVEVRGELPVYDIQTESGEYLSGNIRVHNCFILAVEDTMRSILNWYVEEGTIFKGGSGAGINLSTIRSSQESLKGGGAASGPVSFMRGADASAGTIKSGGKTRRAAKMVILNADHPDVEHFIWCKAVEERKARVLRDAGFDMDLDGSDSHSTQYQNANNSVRVTDEFMQAVVDDADWHLRAVTTGDTVRTIKARDLFRQIATAAWECADPGMQFDTTINRWHTASKTGRINASNPCSEYMHLDNSACNLASINLLKFLDPRDRFDTEGFRQASEVMFTAQEILVGNADYPTEPIAETSRRFRQLGLGYANLGALLMALGLPYDSDEGRAWAAAITALMTGHAYATSARIASRMGPFAGYTQNAEPMNRVLGMHRDASLEIDESLVPIELLSAAQESWEAAVELAEWFGVRNSQASVLAPTGTIGLMMDCDTTGIEPDLGLCKTKKLVGGGTMSIVNQTVPRALRRLGYGDGQVTDIIAYIDEHKTIMGAPHLSADHLPVFACSMGDNVIHYRGHVKMMGAVQPFISGAISKTINAPEEITVEEVEQLHIDAWKLGLKAVAIYRDNCKVAQPLSATKSAGALAAEATATSASAASLVPTVVDRQPIRQKLPRVRSSKTFSFRVADCHGYVTVGEYEDGRPGEIFLKVAKQGSTLAGIMDAFAISVSHGLQYGVPLKAFIDMYTNMRFEPAGMTDDPDLRFASSLVDYIFRRLAVEYLPLDERAELGILTIDERMQPTLPGVEESSTPTSTGGDVVPDPAPRALAPTPAPPPAPAPAASQPAASDAPYCYQCGMVMQRAGACFVCSSCGTTSGCS
jgi:adenosylcobalamin-dependent ribonucleoside-diphosphate reductase